MVNEQHGHDRGDAVLVKVAERIRTSLRQRDSLARGVIAITRVGGDEFLVLCETVSDETGAVAIATRAARDGGCTDRARFRAGGAEREDRHRDELELTPSLSR